MANLHDDAWRGSLTVDKLERYLSQDNVDIDSPGGPKNVTPLAAACWRGHINVVRLLLDNPYVLANPDALSPHRRTPLFFATSRCPQKNRAAVVEALLKAGAEVDAQYPDDGMYTPLMNAIVEVKDRDVVRILIDAKASLTIKNSDKKTAEDLAKGTPLEQALKGSSSLSASFATAIDVFVSIIMFIVAWTNSARVVEAVDLMTKKVTEKVGVVKKLYGLSGDEGSGNAVVDDDVKKSLEGSQTVADLKANIDTYVKDSGNLQKFFKPGDTFLHELAEKANALKDDPNETLNSPESIKRLTRLALYQPVIYCDDSGSMDTDNRYQTQSALVQRIARIATKLVPDGYGVQLSFINYPGSYNLNAAQFEAVMKSVSPSGGTRLGTNLRSKILQPLVYDTVDKGQKLQRPLLICTITDGHPDPEHPDTYKQAIVECKRKLVNRGYDPTAVMFLTSQIGNDPKAKKFLQDLSDDAEIAEVLYCTSDRLDAEFREYQGNERRLDEWLLKTMTAPIMGRDED